MNILNQYIICLSVTSATLLLLGSLVYFKNRTKSVNKTFLWYNISTALWSGCEAYAISTYNKTVVLIWWRIDHIGIIFIPTFFLHFVFSLLDIKGKKRLLILASYISSFVFLCINTTPLLVREVVPKFSFRYFINPGVLYPLFLLFWVITVVYGIFELFKAYLNSSGGKRNQLKYLCWGTLIGYLGGSANFLPVFGIEIFPINPFGTYGVPIYTAMMAYAIARHRLMDINIAIRKIIANLLLVALVGGIVISLYISPLSLVFKNIAAFVFAILIVLYLPKLKFLLEGFINRLLYGTKYDYQETLVEVSNTVPTIIDLDKLLKYIADKVCEGMGIDKAAVLLKDDIGNRYSMHYQRGFDGEKASSIRLEAQGPLVSRIKNTEDVLVRHEMIQILEEDSFRELCTDLDRLAAEVVVPIRKGDNLIGLLSLSDKAGGDTFGQEDFRLLHIIAIQAAVAIENIRLYNKLIHADRQTFLETLASGVSHEMRNRLVAIRTFIDLFPERVDLGHVEKGYIEFRELAVREMARLTKIIDGLLSYSRAVTIGGETLNVNGLVDEALLIIQPKLREKEIGIETNLDKSPYTLTGDKGRLIQVFINIMQNGVDAMSRGGKLNITTKGDDKKVEIDISDTGKGISKEHLPYIFEPFFTTKHTGTGLGLSIVQRIVRDHEGDIRVNSEPGKGTTFIITLPKGGKYKPSGIEPKKGLGYWDVKKEYELPKQEDEKGKI